MDMTVDGRMDGWMYGWMTAALVSRVLGIALYGHGAHNEWDGRGE